MMVFYAIRAPVTKTLYAEAAKSFLVGGLMGFGHFRVRNYMFNENI
jgi:hypothetical protein